MAPVTQFPNVESVAAINVVVYFLSLPLFILYLVVLLLASIGFLEIMFKFNPKSRGNFDLLINDDHLEPVTILRPLKGIDTEMMICLESSFKQNYPHDKYEILFCVQDNNDPAVKIAQGLIDKYPEIDAKLMIDSDQANLDNYGPNPKINNLAKGYKNAKHDLLWVLDSNVWTRPDTLKRSVYTINHNLQNGLKLRDSRVIDALLGGHKKVKLVNHVPLAISLDNGLGNLGCKLDQMFLSTSHSKFYVALNKIQPAPCVNGKSNLYRRSDLDLAVYRMAAVGAATNASSDGMSGDLTKDAKFFSSQNGEGIRFFARYIGEDNMIAIALWNFIDGCAGMSKDCVVQPLDGENTVLNYADRRIRWLRVRKYMVLAATLLEPTTECFLSGIIGSFCIGVLFVNKLFCWNWFIFHCWCWLVVDCIQYHSLFRFIVSSIHSPSNLDFPFFLKNGYTRDLVNLNVKSVIKFVPIWLLRELLAFPIWVIAVVGSRIDWRGQPFKIKADLSAERL